MLPQILEQALRANEEYQLVYLNNPKVGCSTIKANLWREIAPKSFSNATPIHDIAGSPFANDIAGLHWIGAARIFTFVRNPYTRIASAYLNKIKGREPGVWEWFVARYGLSLDSEVSFNEFIAIISNDNQEELDPHWRPQHINTMYPFVMPNFLGYLEEMDQSLPVLLSRTLGKVVEETPRAAVHGTNAVQRLYDIFDDQETLDRFHDIYGLDFEYYGYPLDLESAPFAPRPPQGSDHEHKRLELLYRLRSSTEVDARRKAVEEMERSYMDIRRDKDMFAENWLLMQKITVGAVNADGQLEAVASNMDAILAGYEFLRRTAARVSVNCGEWRLAERIAHYSVERHRHSWKYMDPA